MHDVVLVTIMEGLPNLPENRHRFFQGQRDRRLARDALRERAMRSILRHHVGSATMQAGIK